MKLEFWALGTYWNIVFYQDINLDKISKSIISITKDFESKYSRFIDSSYIGALNHQKEISNFPDELFEMISFCTMLYKITEGSFNICVGTYLDNFGYDSNKSFEKKPNEIISIDNGILHLDKELIQIKENILIDLGGIGKGWLIDKIKDYLLNQNILYFLINGGGDIYATSNNGDPIPFILENPFNISESIGTICIKNSSIAASSSNRRNWISNEIKYHHLIDSKNGECVKNIYGVFTQSESALLSDSASTCLFVSENKLWKNIADKLQTEYLIIFMDQSYIKSPNYCGELHK